MENTIKNFTFSSSVGELQVNRRDVRDVRNVRLTVHLRLTIHGKFRGSCRFWRSPSFLPFLTFEVRRRTVPTKYVAKFLTIALVAANSSSGSSDLAAESQTFYRSIVPPFCHTWVYSSADRASWRQKTVRMVGFLLWVNCFVLMHGAVRAQSLTSLEKTSRNLDSSGFWDLPWPSAAFFKTGSRILFNR